MMSLSTVGAHLHALLLSRIRQRPSMHPDVMSDVVTQRMQLRIARLHRMHTRALIRAFRRTILRKGHGA